MEAECSLFGEGAWEYLPLRCVSQCSIFTLLLFTRTWCDGMSKNAP